MDRTPATRVPWLAMIPLGLPLFMVNVDLTVVNLALPQIATDLHVALGTLQWVVSGYAIAAAAVMLFGGRLADVLGRRKMFIITTVVFISSSAAAGLARGPAQLIIGRIVQGAGMVAFPIAMAIIYGSFPGERRNLALGIATAISGASAAAGPTLGGIILHVLSWRWIFFINVPLGIAAIVLALRWVRESEPETGHKLDYVGQILLAVGLLAALCAVSEIQSCGCGSPLFLAEIAVGIVFLVLFGVVEQRVENPLLDLSLLNRPFIAANLIRALFQYVCFGVFFLVSLHVQNVLLRTPLAAGLTLLWITVTVGVLSPLAGHCIDRAGVRLPLIVGLLLVGASCFLLSTVSPQAALSEFFLPLLLFGVGAAVLFPGSVSAVLSSAPPGKAGVASGTLYMSAGIGGAIGVALSGLVVHVRAVRFMAERLEAQHIRLTAIQQRCVDRVATGAHSAEHLLLELPQEVAAQIASDAREAFTGAFALNMRIYVALCLVAAAAAWFVRGREQ